MHNAPRFGVKRVAPMQDGEIVPHHKITDLPSMAHDKARLRCMGPERVEQGLALGHLKAKHISIRPPAEKKRLAPGFRIGAVLREASCTAILPSAAFFMSAGRVS